MRLRRLDDAGSVLDSHAIERRARSGFNFDETGVGEDSPVMLVPRSSVSGRDVDHAGGEVVNS